MSIVKLSKNKWWLFLFFFILNIGCTYNQYQNKDVSSPSSTHQAEDSSLLSEVASTSQDPVVIDADQDYFLTLNLRVHIMIGKPFFHSSGTRMNMWVTKDHIKSIVLPEINLIWRQAGIQWKVESIIYEEILDHLTTDSDISYIAGSSRNKYGRSDPLRLLKLYNLMNPINRSAYHELNSNLFHIYLFPFIGNTSQGNAMKRYGYHSVVGVWSNKHNYGAIPEKVLLTEDWGNFKRGSLARTISHEFGHVLGLRHKQCQQNCLMGGVISHGYQLSNSQIESVQLEAQSRMDQ